MFANANYSVHQSACVNSSQFTKQECILRLACAEPISDICDPAFKASRKHTFKYGLSLQFAAVADGRTEGPHQIWAQCAPAFPICLSPTGLPGYRNSNFQNLHFSGLGATLRPGATRLPGLAHGPLCLEHMQRSPAWAPGMSPGTQSCSDKNASSVPWAERQITADAGCKRLHSDVP